MKKSQTKRALVMSVLSMLLCFTMLVGTTFAWFTDEATSSGNLIQAGTLDIALELRDEDGFWVDVEKNNVKIFNYDKWEPGYTTISVLRIANYGTLDAKWKAVFLFDQAPSMLADVIDVYSTVREVYDADPTARPDFANDQSWKYLGTITELVANNGEVLKADLLEAGHAQHIVIALKMRESAGNEYQGLDLGGKFDITILATQAASESDSFNNQYDANATFPTTVDSAEAANTALANGGNATLIADLTTDSNIVMNGGALNGNGKTLTASYSGTGVNAGVYTTGGAISNLNIANGDVNAAKGLRAIYISGAITADTIVENCVIDATYTINTSLSSDVPYGLYVSNSTLNGWTSYDHIEEAVFTNCEFGEGSTGYANLRPYTDTTLTSCEFSEGFTITRHSTYSDFTITLNHCTVNGVAVTADNFMTLLAGAQDGYSLHGTTITVIVDGVEVVK